jgi:hypothetical protein
MPTRRNYQQSRKKNALRDDQFQKPREIHSALQFTEERRKKIIDWATFYRRNIHRFVQHYFGIKLHFYQIIWIYLMSINDTFVAICSRADGKSWLVAVFACAKAILYPRSEIVICSSTKEQAGIIVSDKIASLREEYPNLAREIKTLTTNMNQWQVVFHNGSVIRVVASRDSARGNSIALYDRNIIFAAGKVGES